MTRSSDSLPTDNLRTGGVLVVSESATDAVLIKTLLKEDFDNVVVKITADGNVEAAEFLELHPKVLLLAFRDMATAERCCLGLYRSRGASVLQPHRTVILCAMDAVNQAFELCRRGLFDDYVQFWPMTYDAARLRMTVHRALAELASAPENAPSAMTIAAQARRIVELEALLSPSLAQGPAHIGATGQARNAHRESGHAVIALAAQVRPAVLIVDDDEFQQSLLALMLEPEGYELSFASSGSVALEQLGRAPVDCILMDFKLPDMNGIEVTKRLKEDPRLAAIPVIMITGNSERDIVLGSRRIGAVDFIVKPVDRRVLLDKLHRLSAGAEATVARLPCSA
ncbi:MAG TPA: response regulator [Steroidobacteraceae bacterium]|jgi:CheY-like chemotaxis protein|nr:response regulator [Steroidobacteraceae bacterium]